MLAQLEHFNACIIQKSLYVTGCAKSDFFVASTKLLSCMFTATVIQDCVVCCCWQPNPTEESCMVALVQLCGVDKMACAVSWVVMSSVWSLQVYPIFTVLPFAIIYNQYQCLHIGNTASYCRAIDIFCRLMDTFRGCYQVY